MIIIAYILSTIMVVVIVREIAVLVKDLKRWIYLYDKWQHSMEHIILLTLIIAWLITMLMTCWNDQKIPIIAYTLINILFIVPHLKKERTSNDL